MTSHIVQVFLPLSCQGGSPQPRAAFAAVRKELLGRCGGVTISARAPAEGLWQDDEGVDVDRIVIFEAMDDILIRSGGHNTGLPCSRGSTRRRSSSEP